MGGPAAKSTAMLTCTFGAAPSTLTVLPTPRVLVEGMPVGTITDNAPVLNIPPFGVCTSLGNPQVAAATAAALGVLTPMPCVPAVAAPWVSDAPKTLVGGKPVITVGSKCQCMWGGLIQVVNPGTTKTIVS